MVGAAAMGASMGEVAAVAADVGGGVARGQRS
jgi:hypothetical protein